MSKAHTPRTQTISQACARVEPGAERGVVGDGRGLHDDRSRKPAADVEGAEDAADPDLEALADVGAQEGVDGRR